MPFGWGGRSPKRQMLLCVQAAEGGAHTRNLKKRIHNKLQGNLFIDGSCNLFLCLLIAEQPSFTSPSLPSCAVLKPWPPSWPAKGPLCIRNCQLLPFWQTSHQATAGCQLPVASFQLSSTLGSCMLLLPASCSPPPGDPLPCKYVGIINIFQSIDFWPLWMLSMLMMSDGRQHQSHLVYACALDCIP